MRAFVVVFDGALSGVAAGVAMESVRHTLAMHAEVDSHTVAVRTSVSQIASELERALGQRLTAVIAGVADAKAIGKWARGERAPRPDSEQRLRDAYYVVTLLGQAESPSTIRAWLCGMNPELDDRAPALVLAEDAPRVLQAARTFLAHG